MNNNYNGYNPYQNYYPYMNRSIPYNNINSFSAPRSSGGLLSRLFGGSRAATAIAPGIASGVGTAAKSFSFSGLLNGASKTLGVINQAIPVFYQVKPIWNNAKTMFRVAKAMTSSDTSNINNNTKISNTNNINNDNSALNSNNNSSKSNEPTFFQ